MRPSHAIGWLVLWCASACGWVDGLRARLSGDVAAQIVAGWDHACLRTQAGKVWCWGELEHDEAHATPELIDFGGVVTSLAAGGSGYTCALLQDGTVACSDYDGVRKVKGITDATSIAVLDGGAQGCAIRKGGAVTCWMGPPPMELPEELELELLEHVPGLEDATALAGGQGFCALREDAPLACWGYGLMPFDVPASKVPVDTALRDLVTMASASWHLCGAKANGEVVCVGENAAGQLGDGTSENSTTGVAPTGLSDVRSLAAAFTRTIAVDGSGHVYWWGDPKAAAHSDGPRSSTTPKQVDGLDDVVEAATGIRFACARTRAGEVSCWGRNDHGQLGDGTTTERAEPASIQWSPP